MLKCTIDREKMEGLNNLIKGKNNLSPLNRFVSKDLTKEGISSLDEIGIIDSDGNLLETMKSTMEILSKPHAVVKVIFTGGVGAYEHNINYDNSFQNHVSFTVTPNNVSIDDESDPLGIIKIMEDFVGKSNLKSVNISRKFNVAEAFVVASMLDMERKSILRAFVDEVPFTHNSYNTSMIWRIMNSTSSSIQWFVCIMNEIIGEYGTLSQKQVQDAINQLIAEGAITQNGGQYQLSSELSLLASRMIIVDNILSVQTSKQDEIGEIISAGFTCVQSGVHDLLFLDYDGKEIVFETITSVRLMDYLDQFLNCKSYFAKMHS